MKRWSRALAGCAGLGLAATVVVAWVCCVMADPARFDPQLTAQLRRADFAAADGGEPEPWLDSAWRAPGLQVLLYRESSRPERREYSIRAGWPLPALWGAKVAETDHDESHHVAAIGLPVNVDLRFVFHSRVMIKDAVPRLLPLAPCWPGLLVDTALLAIPMALLVLGARRTRRLWRRRRGCCPQCGYDLRGGDAGGCPECGRRGLEPG